MNNQQADYHIEQIPLGHPGIRRFAMFPWHLYRNDPCWTPPLTAELLGNRLFGIVGLLKPEHHYHRNAEVTHFLAWRGKESVGRISAAINHRFNEYHNLRIGFFGFFEVINDYQVAKMLIDEACRWVKERGMTVLRGPGGYSNVIQERQGILIDGFNYPPTFNVTHNPPFYADFIERYGFTKAMDYHSYIMNIPRDGLPRLKALSQQIRKRHKFETRPADMKMFDHEVRLLTDIWNDTWTQNWGFLPITDEEASDIGDALRSVVDPGGVRFVFVDGEPAAMVCAVPDPNYCLKPHWRWYGDSDLVRLARLFLGKKRIPRTEIFFLGVRSPFRNWGLEAVLVQELLEYSAGLHYQTCEASWILENNTRIFSELSKFIDVRHHKTWRIYDLPLS